MIRSFLLAFLLTFSCQVAFSEELPHQQIHLDDILAVRQDGDLTIMILDTKNECTTPGYFDAYAMQKDMTAAIGCWTDNKEQTGFLITWDTGNTVSVSAKSFTFLKARYI